MTDSAAKEARTQLNLDNIRTPTIPAESRRRAGVVATQSIIDAHGCDDPTNCATCRVDVHEMLAMMGLIELPAVRRSRKR